MGLKLAGTLGFGAALLSSGWAQTGAPVPVASPGAQVNTAAPAGEQAILRGRIGAGEVSLPGVAVTATSSGSGMKYTTTTDIDGNFRMAVPAGAQYSISAQLSGFALETKDVTATVGEQTQSADFAMELASRAPTRPATPAEAAAPPATAAPSAHVATAAPAAERPAATRPGAPAGTPQRSAAGAARGTVARVGRGSQVIDMQQNQDSGTLDASLGQGNTGVTMPSVGGASAGDDVAAASLSDTVAVSGQQGQTNGLAGFSEDQIRQRIGDMQRQGGGNGDIANMLMGAMGGGGLGGPGGPGGLGGPGGPGGPGGGFGGRGGGGGGGFGRGFRGQNANAWHGAFAYTGSNSALNAIPFSVTGTPVIKPASDTNTLIGTVTGIPYIPGLTKPNPKQFAFISFQETRNTIPTIAQAIVPTAAQRLGDLTGQGSVYDPNTGKPYGASNCAPGLAAIDPSPAACIPATELNSSAQSLLNFYPLPNITPTGTNENFQTVTSATSHSSQISGRFNRSFGQAPVRGGRGGFGGGGGGRGGGGGQNGNGQNRNSPPVLRQSIAEQFAYSHQASSSQSYSQFLGGKNESNGYNISSSYTVGYGRLNSTATIGWNRSNALGSNYFTNALINPAVAAGVAVADPTIYGNPFYFGVPAVSITGFSGLSDVTPSNTVNQTLTVSDFVAWSHKRHNMRFGLDFHRIHLDSIGGSGSNPLGSFTFSGFATQSPAQQACSSCSLPATGSSIADFLVGHPQQTAVTAGLSKIYLRGNSWDWYAQDDWRARANLTMMFGLRWEYFSPYSEKNGHLVNLNVTGRGASLQANNVCATASTGCQQVGSGPLVNPDRSMYSPRIGIAYQPKFKFTKNTVIRTGYGINYNTGQYSRFAQRLAFQQPFAITQTNTIGLGSCTLSNMTLASGFNCSNQLVQSNYGVNPNYRLGLVQVINFGIQRTLPQGIVFNVDYNGAYAGNLDMLRAPNRNAYEVLNPNVTQFTYEDSLGYQRSNALAVNLRQRMKKGISLQGTYTYAHSIDNASSVGGSGNFIAQNDQNLGAEESNSSFDRRHSFNGNFVIELPFGPNRAFLNKGGVWAKIMDGYSLSGNYAFATGGWATPAFATTASEVAAGAPSSLRPNRNFGVPVAGGGSLRSWFNRAAFQTTEPVDATGRLTYGSASRNSIELPGTVSVNGVLSRTISLGETRSIEARFQANNVFNTVQYSGVYTTVNLPTFGQVSGAAAMRSFVYTARFRF
jgi:hypothetical protein